METGQIIQHRYQIVQVLGQGSMGTTYKALDLKTQHPVAVKLLHFSRLQEWKALELFEREARVLQQLNHPRIPAYIDFFSLETSSDVRFFLVQEYIEGKTIQELVEEGWRGTEAEVFDIVEQLVDILKYLHSLEPPVIHRDINPKNIILKRFPSEEACPEPVEGGAWVSSVSLVDFGAIQERIHTTFLGGSTIVGTYGYIPFEQFSGQAVPASDYYALGATLLYVLTHRHPSDFPIDEMKPQFHFLLQTSPKIVRLLDGLLEPSVKNRITSSEQVRAILEEPSGKPQVRTRIPLALSQRKISKPPETKIEKIVTGSDCICFRFPKKILTSDVGKIFSILKKPAILEITPERIRLSNPWNSWSVPTNALHPSDITWYFGGNKPVLEIRCNGGTYLISDRLTSAEAEWLYQEIVDYVSTTYQAQTPFEQPPKPAKPTKTKIKKIVEGNSHVRFCLAIDRIWGIVVSLFLGYPALICGVVFLTEKDPFAFFGVLLFMLVTLFVVLLSLGGKQVVDITPTWIQTNMECFGLNIRNLWRIPTPALQPSNINWYLIGPQFKVYVSEIHYAGKKFELVRGFAQDEIEWLAQEIKDCIVEFGKPENQKVAKPPATKIKKTSPTPDSIGFQIPGNILKSESLLVNVNIQAGLTLIVFSIVSLVIIPTEVPLLFAGVCFLGGVMSFVLGLPSGSGQTSIDLTPSHLQIRYHQAGKNIRQATLSSATIRKVEVSIRHRFLRREKRTICIYSETNTLQLGSRLTLEEQQWFVQEINAYLTRVRHSSYS